MKEKISKFVEKALILKPYLKLLSEGRIFKLILSWFLRALAVIIVIGFIVEWVTKWSFVFKMKGSMVLVLAVIMLIALVAVFCIINVILFKADAVAALPENEDYIVIPIAVIFIKMIGEISLFICAFIGISGFLLALPESGAMVLRAFPFFSGSGFASGLSGLILSIVVGFISFFSAYFVAEQVGVFADIARNTKK